MSTTTNQKTAADSTENPSQMVRIQFPRGATPEEMLKIIQDVVAESDAKLLAAGQKPAQAAE